MSAITAKTLTAEEFFLLPEPRDGGKQELVRGEVVAVSSPGFEHGEIQIAVGTLIKNFLRKHRIGRVVSESGVITERGPDTVLGPDLSYYSKERVPLEERIVGYHTVAPDLCIEILSPSNPKRKMRTKIEDYFRVNVLMVWVIDPEDRSLTILKAPNSKEGRTFYEDAQIDGGDVLPGFTCKVSECFE